ncbi:MAG TPA: MGMT family protein [Elusimicrobiota bacterium]|nr:MGMT family protein [Elusimicrobiota bacterium]
METVSSNYARIYAVVRRVPRGRVATYGQVAALAGLPRHARQVGYALHSLPDDAEVPWQRIVNSKGEISARCHPYAVPQQRELLESEGVKFDKTGRIPLERFQWNPKR